MVWSFKNGAWINEECDVDMERGIKVSNDFPGSSSTPINLPSNLVKNNPFKKSETKIMSPKDNTPKKDNTPSTMGSVLKNIKSDLKSGFIDTAPRFGGNNAAPTFGSMNSSSGDLPNSKKDTYQEETSNKEEPSLYTGNMGLRDFQSKRNVFNPVTLNSTSSLNPTSMGPPNRMVKTKPNFPKGKNEENSANNTSSKPVGTAAGITDNSLKGSVKPNQIINKDSSKPDQRDNTLSSGGACSEAGATKKCIINKPINVLAEEGYYQTSEGYYQTSQTSDKSRGGLSHKSEGVQTLRPFKAYLRAVEHTLRAAMCMMDMPSPLVERQNRPEIEVEEMGNFAICKPIYISRDSDERCKIECSINSVRASFSFRKQSDDVERALVRKYTTFLTQRASSTLDILRKKPIPGFDISFVFAAAGNYMSTSSYYSASGACNGDIIMDGDDPAYGGLGFGAFGGYGPAYVAEWNAPTYETEFSGAGAGQSLRLQSRDKLIDFVLSFLEDFDRDVKDMKLGLNSHLRAACAEYVSSIGQYS